MKLVHRSKEPLQPIDYAFMIGGPIVFLLIAWIGVMQLLGPAPAENPVAKLRRDVVKAGMPEAKVIELVGPPKGIEPLSNGGYSFRYQRSGWNQEQKTLQEEDAYVDFTASGTVSSVNFDSREPLPPDSLNKAKGK